MDSVTLLRSRLAKVWPSLDERARRLMAAQEAINWGHGGISAVHRTCGMSRDAIRRGIAEIEAGAAPETGRIRRAGAGRKSVTTTDPRLLAALDLLIAPEPGREPDSPLRWICKSTRELAADLRKQGHTVSHFKLALLLQGQHFSLQGNRKIEADDDYDLRMGQFRRINTVVKRALVAGRPVMSVETHRRVRLDGAVDRLESRRGERSLTERRTIPCGIYDIARDADFVSVDTDCDAGVFAVASICGWWRAEGRRLYPRAQELTITVGVGRMDGDRRHLWTLELQKLADATGLTVTVCHFPPGTRKWNKVEHRLFSFISSNWITEPPRHDETVVNLIARATTATGLTVHCRLDQRKHLPPRAVSKVDVQPINLERDALQGHRNYRIQPHPKATSI
jgi:Rhodopirellula transposase DDE domain